MAPSCEPVPTSAAYSMGRCVGARKTSACTSFQPASSLASSTEASLYCAMSRCRLRNRIMPTSAVRNSTISVEFAMLNQCTRSWGWPRRYTSQRCAQGVALRSQTTS